MANKRESNNKLLVLTFWAPDSFEIHLISMSLYMSSFPRHLQVVFDAIHAVFTISECMLFDLALMLSVLQCKPCISCANSFRTPQMIV